LAPPLPLPLAPPPPATESSSRSTVPCRTTPDKPPGITDVLDQVFRSVLVACRNPQFP
jgi:hypothetical protein